VRQDVDRVGEVDERVQPVAGGVLRPVLVADALGEANVLAHPARQHGEPEQQFGVALPERRDRRRLLGVEHGAVGQHDAHAGQRVVAVLARAAAHAAGVVGGDAADLGGVD
jgi:hypothetical protein